MQQKRVGRIYGECKKNNNLRKFFESYNNDDAKIILLLFFVTWIFIIKENIKYNILNRKNEVVAKSIPVIFFDRPMNYFFRNW